VVLLLVVLVVLVVLVALLLVVLVVLVALLLVVLMVLMVLVALEALTLEVNLWEVHHLIIHFNNLYISQPMALLVVTFLINTTSTCNPISYLS